MSWYGDPAGLDRLAGTLSSAAVRVRERASVVRSPATATRWRGPAAEAFRAAVAHEAALLERAADELDDAGAVLRRHAESVRHELAQLAAVRYTVEHAVEHAVAGGLAQVERLVP